MAGVELRHRRTANLYKQWLGTVKNPDLPRQIKTFDAIADAEFRKETRIGPRPKKKTVKI